MTTTPAGAAASGGRVKGRVRGTVVLVGAGLGGSLLAILLGRAGYTVRGFEMRSDPRRGPGIRRRRRRHAQLHSRIPAKRQISWKVL